MREDQLWEGGPRFLFDTSLFPPTTDSFALGYFAHPRRNQSVCDLGSGTGLLGVLLMARDPSLHLVNVEWNEAALTLARKNFAKNHWDAAFCRGDLRDASVLPAPGSMDYAVCNPPYFKSGSGKSSETLPNAREEVQCSLSDICAAARWILRWGGRLALVHRPERLTDLLCTLREHGLEPKRLRFIVQSAEAAPSLLLLEARRGGKPGLSIEPPLVTSGAEWNRVYFRDRPSQSETAGNTDA